MRQENSGMSWSGLVGRIRQVPGARPVIARQPQLVLPDIQGLIDFMQRREIPAPLHVAVAHAQFETIHPFVDGNGRTGGAFAHAMLRQRNLTTRTTAPISAGILRNTGGYFRALTAFRHGHAAPIIRTFIDASTYAVATGEQLVKSLAAALDQSRSQLAGVRSDSTSFTLLPLLIAQPVIEIGGTSYPEDDMADEPRGVPFGGVGGYVPRSTVVSSGSIGGSRLLR
ncbi:Fic family protein [Glutamicibacter sp. MNS18]|uniref:Fic family protein n=1 Tax=Glutamicibacter sp. MNS18 TaxID=2989817 RepID=UPI0022367B45|nr:Fic family protein [Glutamicibacter sp. MNS18]MCW4466778.1 Fic family protein [Glutamicibacter sp. MNS18]